MVELIPLRTRDGKVRAYAKVDAADYEALSRQRWALDKDGYAVGSIRTDEGHFRQVFMHRMLLGLVHGDGKQGDHINRDRLDNRRANLRVVTAAQQAQNKPSIRGSKSRFRGVSHHPGNRTKPWRADVKINGVSYYLGYYTREEEAARVAAAFRADNMPYSQEALA